MCGSGSLATALAHRDEDEERAERRVGDVGEDVVEVGEAEHEVAAEGVVEALVVVVIGGVGVDARPRHLIDGDCVEDARGDDLEGRASTRGILFQTFSVVRLI